LEAEVAGTRPESGISHAPAQRAAWSEPDHERNTILVVEDEEFVRKVTCEVLSFAGYQVLEARTAVEALRLFEQCRKNVQLLLTDVVLPGRNGGTLSRELKALQPRLKTIFTSGYPENEIAKHGLQEPDVFYLAKPFSVESLMRKITGVLGQNGGADVKGEMAKHASHSG
jgi:two-component system cell cycle sensor histidine kinase/response regulator CckA